MLINCYMVGILINIARTNNKNGVSLKIVSTSGYDYEILDFKAPPRKISLNLFLFPFKFIKTISAAKKILNKVSPIAVVGMGAYLSLGIVLTITGQALINMGMTTGVLPSKGIPLPFISYGGSAMLINCYMVGILVNIARSNSRLL
ncbi:MAG: FtsW/RodA/SpoVE family cell cycle protein [Elusimicrobia bacterium]|nr:FtsW/RodA/SpoVE family cell cycle protein [Elusimicrobiota bacterium]